MKLLNIFIFISISFLCLSCTTTKPTAQQEESLKKIKEFPNLNKSELYNRSLEWVARNYSSTDETIQLKDPKEGKIIARGVSSTSFGVGIQRYFQYTMIIEMKDGKIRTRYENVQSIKLDGVAGPNMKMQWETVKDYLLNDLSEQLFTSIKNYEKEDDW